MSRKVIVAGHICVDITPVIPGEKVKTPGDLLMPGKLIHTGPAQISTGGVVANTGLAMKFLGAEVSLMGLVGDDAFGKIILEQLRRHGAEKDMLISDEVDSSYTVVLAIPGVDRMFLHNPGANDVFRAEHLPQEALQEAALFHFGYPPIMRSMYENEGEELEAVLRRAGEAGAAVSLDMAAVDPASDAGKADWEAILKKVLPLVDFFVPSVEELCYMLDHERFEEWQKRAAGGDITKVLDIERDIRPLADLCMECGVKILMIKCGEPGIYYRTAGEAVLEKIPGRLGLDVKAWADKEGFERSFKADKVLSGTGAGDTSIAAFLTAMLEGGTPEVCVQLASATGACCVEAYDSLSGLKTFDVLREKIAAGWDRL